MLKKIISSTLVLLVTLGLVSCTNKTNNTSNSENLSNMDKIKVVASFNPMREFAEAIGKDKIIVSTVIPEGTEPHDFEPKAKDLELLNKAKVFIYNGLEMEEWVEKSLEAVKNKDLVVVETSKGAELLKLEEHDELEDKKEEHEHGEYDPHIWLSLKEAKVASKNILEALVKVDAPNKDFYEKNYNEFVGKLDSLYADYKKKFEAITNRNFVTGHEAFGYLCRDFGLEQKSVEGMFSEGEPTAQKLKELVDYCKANGIKVIFMEELASPKVSETLAKEVKGKVEKIYTIESKEDGKDYIQSMKENLEKIYNSLK